MKTVLTKPLSGYNLSAINSNFDKLMDVLQNAVLFRDNPTGEPNSMQQSLDMNSKRVFNLGIPGSSSDAARIKDVQFQVGGLVPATLIPFEPSSGIVSDTVQGALQEIIGIFRNQGFVTPFNFGAKGDGLTNDTAAIQAALNTGFPVSLAGRTFLSSALTVTNNKLLGPGKLIGTGAVSNGPLVTGATGELRGVTIQASTGGSILYGVLQHEAFDVIDNVFIGDYGHCILASDCKYAKVSGNKVKKGGNHITPIVISASEEMVVSNNIIEDHSGFGIQLRYSGNVSVVGNSISQQYFMQSFTATSPTQTFVINTGRSVTRFSAFNDGGFKALTGTVQNTPTNYSITVSGLTVGQPVGIYSFVGLECIQLNSGCYGVTVEGNVVKCSGDSGIVVGADYHFTPGWGWGVVGTGAPNPGAVVASDYAKNSTISGNTITGPVLAAGIAVNDGDGIVVTGNTISDVGYIPDPAYQNGVVLGNVTNCLVRDNVVDGRNGHMFAAVKFTGGGVDASNVIGFNRGISCKNLETFADSQADVRRYGYTLPDAKVNTTLTDDIRTMLASTWVGGAYTQGANIDVVTSGATGAAKDSGQIYQFYTSFRTVAGQYLEIIVRPAINAILVNKIVRVSFVGKADNAGDSGSVALYYAFPGDDVNPAIVMDINQTSWIPMVRTLAMKQVNSFSVRVTGNAGATRVNDLRIDILDPE